MNYCMLIADVSKELLAIFKYDKELSELPWRESDLDNRICKFIGTREWMWADTTQVEFETYQAFGITEVKLCDIIE